MPDLKQLSSEQLRQLLRDVESELQRRTNEQITLDQLTGHV